MASGAIGQIGPAQCHAGQGLKPGPELALSHRRRLMVDSTAPGLHQNLETAP